MGDEGENVYRLREFKFSFIVFGNLVFVIYVKLYGSGNYGRLGKLLILMLLIYI